MTHDTLPIDPETRRFERRVLLLVALIQFINIWDFMMVMPLGPDFSHALGIDVSHLGWIAGSYSIAAAIVGILSARYIDRFDRRSVLLFSLSGMMVTTLAMIFASNLYELIALRVATGAFGGPVIASSMAVIADVFPDRRRGEAVGKVFGSFSLAAVLGVPLSLEIAHYFGWWAPFLAVSLVAAITIGIVHNYLPPMRKHLEQSNDSFSLFIGIRNNPAMRRACMLMGATTFAAFLLIPNISAYVQQNMNYPRGWLGMLYFCGGGAAFFSMRFLGKRSDHIGYAHTSLLATALLWLCVWLWFYEQVYAIPAAVYFIVFMVAMSTRNVTSNALISKIPKPSERAGFMSLMSAIQHLMSGAGAAFSTLLLSEKSGGALQGMDTLALINLPLLLITPWMMFQIEKILAAKNPAN